MDGYASQGDHVDFISHRNGTVFRHHIGAIRTLVEVDQLLFVLWTFFQSIFGLTLVTRGTQEL